MDNKCDCGLHDRAQPDDPGANHPDVQRAIDRAKERLRERVTNQLAANLARDEAGIPTSSRGPERAIRLVLGCVVVLGVALLLLL